MRGEKITGIFWLLISTAFMVWMLWQAFKSDPISGTIILVIMLVFWIGAAYGMTDDTPNQR